MSTHKRIVQVLLICAIIVTPFTSLPAQSSASIPWMDDSQAAIDRAGRESKPIVVLITGGAWCDPCNWFRENTLRDPSLVALIRNAWVPLRLRDVEVETERWPEDIVPTLLFLDSDGEEIDRIAGTATAQTVRARMVDVNRMISGECREV